MSLPWTKGALTHIVFVGGRDLRSSRDKVRGLKMIGFRNVIAHDYEKINYDIVYEVLQKGVVDIEEFIERIGGL